MVKLGKLHLPECAGTGEPQRCNGFSGPASSFVTIVETYRLSRNETGSENFVNTTTPAPPALAPERIIANVL